MTRLVVVTGLSGSGKTQALRCLEDMGYFAVDNLPIPLIPSFVELLGRSQGAEARGAFVADVRDSANLAGLPAVLQDLRQREGLDLRLLFLEAQEETLVRRFSESRRPHPLDKGAGTAVADAIRAEASLLAELRAAADAVIGTDAMSPHELRRMVQNSLDPAREASPLHVRVVSFGFKFGLPREADMVFDARFLPNPYFKPDLRSKDGRDGAVSGYLEQQAGYREFAERVEELLGFVMPRFVGEGKSYFTLGIGCTGGRHRSVALAERLAAWLRGAGYQATVTHRDIDRDAERPR